LNILAAAKGVGKSYFALALGVGIAQTGHVFNHDSEGIEVEVGDILYIANESDRSEMKDRLEVPTDLDEWPERLQTTYGSKRLDEGLIVDLEAWLTSHPDARLVIIDILANVRTSTRRSGNPYHADIQEMTPLHRLALKHGVAILAVSHAKKGEAEDWTHAFMGWEAGAAAVCLKLERKFGETEGSLELQGRGLPPSKWKLEFDSRVWSIAGKGEEFFASEASQRVIEILRQAGKEVHYKDIAVSLGKTEP
jgi:RecA-family ATPase